MDLKKLLKNKNLGIAIGLLGTGIGAYGGMPSPPSTFVKAVEKYPLLQWFLVYVLVWQGAGGYDEQVSLMGTLIIFTMVKLVEYAENSWDLEYKLGLDKKTKAQKQAEKQVEKQAEK